MARVTGARIGARTAKVKTEKKLKNYRPGALGGAAGGFGLAGGSELTPYAVCAEADSK
jgi:hypothetical protein